MGQIYLIRHGRTRANEEHLYCGATDIPLSENGKRELEGFRYQVPENTVYMISGMLRTKETLELLFGKVPYEVEEGFREIHFGDFEMKSYEELKESPIYQAWISGNNDQNIPPNGESGEQMTLRVMEAFWELQKRTENIVLISHGGVIAAIMQQLFPEEKKNRYQWQPKPGHGYLLVEGSYQELETNENII